MGEDFRNDRQRRLISRAKLAKQKEKLRNRSQWVSRFFLIVTLGGAMIFPLYLHQQFQFEFGIVIDGILMPLPINFPTLYVAILLPMTFFVVMTWYFWIRSMRERTTFAEIIEKLEGN